MTVPTRGRTSGSRSRARSCVRSRPPPIECKAGAAAGNHTPSRGRTMDRVGAPPVEGPVLIHKEMSTLGWVRVGDRGASRATAGRSFGKVRSSFSCTRLARVVLNYMLPSGVRAILANWPPTLQID